jgi:hypothetical protein
MSEPILEISIEPDEVFFHGIKPGKVHETIIRLTNEGNVPVVIPENFLPNLQDPDLIAKTLLQGIRDYPKEGTIATLDTLVQNLKDYMDDQVRVSIKEYGKKVEPGKTIDLHLTFKLPRRTKDKYYFEGDIDILTESLFFKIGPG